LPEAAVFNTKIGDVGGSGRTPVPFTPGLAVDLHVDLCLKPE
jgi:hypothetical protein